MEESKLFEALDGLYAYDQGATDSGIHDEALKRQVFTFLHLMSYDQFRITLTKFIRDWFVCEEAVELGYGIEDVVDFTKWLGDNGLDI